MLPQWVLQLVPSSLVANTMDYQTQSPEQATRPGLLDSLKKVTATLLEIVSTRLELLVHELEEERAWLGSLLMWALIAVVFGALGIVLLTLLIVVYFWDSYRMLAMSILTVAFLVGAVVSWQKVLGKTRAKPRLFSTSLGELSKDREKLARIDYEEEPL